MTIDIPQDLARRIEDLADKRGSTIEEFLRELLDRHEPKKPRMTMADLARIAREANLSSDHPVDTAARSREILNTEYADYLKRRRAP